MGLEFLDTDEEVERASGISIADIFRDEGEAGFRHRETEEVLKACGRKRCVIAVGGGAVENPELAQALKNTGVVVLLTAPAEMLHERIAGDASSASRRPALTNGAGLAEVKKVLARRHDAYHSTAHITVDTAGLEPAAVADRIIGELEGDKYGPIFSRIIS